MTAFLLHHQLAGRPDAWPLVMVGSLGTTLEMWEPQMPRLAARRRLVTLDVRGHGLSPTPRGAYSIASLAVDVLTTLDRLRVERADFCGLSIGGMIGIQLAVHAPERIGRLILICTSARLTGSGYEQRAAQVRAAGTTEPVADGVIARWFTPDWAAQHAELVARYRAMLVTTPAEGYAGCCEAVAGFDARAELRRVAASTLVIAGARDRATPPHHARGIAASVPDARLAVVDGAAHLASVEQPDAVTQLIAAHLDPPEAT